MDKKFFFDRNQCTRVGNVESTILPLLSGVIQGSGIIGPLMFVMYINDILREAGVTVRFFADDLKMYARITNCVDITVMQNSLDRLVYWTDLWQLQISITSVTVCISADSKLSVSISKFEIYPYLSLIYVAISVY